MSGLTLWHADLLSVLNLQLVFFEGSFAFLDVGFLVLVEVQDEQR